MRSKFHVFHDGYVIVCISPLYGIMAEQQFKFVAMVCRGMIKKPNSMDESGECMAAKVTAMFKSCKCYDVYSLRCTCEKCKNVMKLLQYYIHNLKSVSFDSLCDPIFSCFGGHCCKVVFRSLKCRVLLFGVMIRNFYLF